MLYQKLVLAFHLCKNAGLRRISHQRAKMAHIYQTIFTLLASKTTDNLLKILNKTFY
ncbi:hypothetical protein PSPO_b1449 [Pseudoalteromonas spongiae UST010723-006]|nr:hypothetical protein PSPO_b1449 [Pseudoalteromonas spongiae UST010723-006]